MEQKEFSVFGYHDAQNCNASNDMIHLEVGQKKGKDMWKSPRIEHADPSKPWSRERFTHSFLKLPKTDCAILFGRVTLSLPYYRSKQLTASQTFEISPVNDVFYLYDNSVKL